MNSHIITCKKCETEFDNTHPKHRGGYINVCGDCGGSKDVSKHMAIIDVVGKTDVRFGLVRNPSPAMQKFIRKQGFCGPGHCHTSLGVGNYSSNDFSDREE